MLKIRLQRIGRKHDPHFRVVVIDSRFGPKSNNFVEWIGVYNPKLGTMKIDGERATHWLSQGAQASDTVHNMLVSEKVIDAKKRNALPKKTPIVAEVEESEEVSAESAPAKEEATSDSKEESSDTPAEDTPKEEVQEEKNEETSAKEEAPKAEEKPAEE